MILFLIGTIITILGALNIKSTYLFVVLISVAGMQYGILSPCFLSEGLARFSNCLGTASALQAFFRMFITFVIGIIGTTIGMHITMLKFSLVLFSLSLSMLILLRFTL
jgi:hypothetical protein